MMSSLISIFDPMTLGGYEIKWVVVVMIFISFSQFWVMNSSLNLLIEKVSTMLSLASMNLFSCYKNSIFLSMSVIMTIFISNESGMIPYVFTSTSHFSFNFSMALPLWMAGVMLLIVKKIKDFFAHLTPMGSPMVLAPFLVLIELISLIIRPMSLSVRLMSNIVAGHMILSLMESKFMIIVLSPMVLVEVGVGIIQSYVFMSLLNMYWVESEH